METITTANTASATPKLIQGSKERFDVSVSGSFTGSVTLQRSKDGSSSWSDIEAFTAAAERLGIHGSAWFYRFRTSSDFSGTTTVFVG